MWIGICHILKISWHRLQLASALIDIRSIWLSIWPGWPFLIQLCSQSCSLFFPSSSKGFPFFSVFIQCLIVKPSPLPRALSWICSYPVVHMLPCFLMVPVTPVLSVGFNSIHYQFLELCIFLSLDSHIPVDLSYYSVSGVTPTSCWGYTHTHFYTRYSREMDISWEMF